jgi:osmoprotectant transport system substrate-binding protein
VRHRSLAALAVLVACGTAACGTGDVDVAAAMQDAPARAAADEPAGPITVGSFDFTESRIVAEIYARALEASGFPVDRAPGVAAREVLEPALEQGLVDLVPEYAGTALAFLTGDPSAPSADAAVTHERLVDAYADRNVVVLDGAEAQNQNALVVRRETAEQQGLADISDLSPAAANMVLGGPPECPSRPLCLLGLRDVYGLRFERFVPLDVGGPVTIAALEGGEIDVAVLFTADRPNIGDQMTFLVDDRGLQPAENITPVLRQDVLRAHGAELERRINEVTRRLKTADLAGLVRRANVDREDPARLADAWLREAGLRS